MGIGVQRIYTSYEQGLCSSKGRFEFELYNAAYWQTLSVLCFIFLIYTIRIQNGT